LGHQGTAAASAAALGEREVTIVDLAMFDAVNSIERRYQPYLEQLPTTDPTSADAAAASAAATALAGLHPETAASFKAALAEYLAHLNAAPESLANGARLGEAVALKILEAARQRWRGPQSIPTVPRPSRAVRPNRGHGVLDLANHAAVRPCLAVASFAPVRRLR